MVTSPDPTEERVREVAEQILREYASVLRTPTPAGLTSAITRALLAERRTAVGWQPIETAPLNILILGTSKSGKYKIGEAYQVSGNIDAVIDPRDGRFLVCTHWMPLPPLAPPDGREQR